MFYLHILGAYSFGEYRKMLMVRRTRSLLAEYLVRVPYLKSINKIYTEVYPLFDKRYMT